MLRSLSLKRFTSACPLGPARRNEAPQARHHPAHQYRTAANRPARPTKWRTVPEGATAARLHLTAAGIYEAFIDGVKVGDHELAPGWTEYRDRFLVQTHDVTQALTPGEHEVAVVLGNG